MVTLAVRSELNDGIWHLRRAIALKSGDEKLAEQITSYRFLQRYTDMGEFKSFGESVLQIKDKETMNSLSISLFAMDRCSENIKDPQTMAQMADVFVAYTKPHIGDTALTVATIGRLLKVLDEKGDEEAIKSLPQDLLSLKEVVDSIASGLSSQPSVQPNISIDALITESLLTPCIQSRQDVESVTFIADKAKNDIIATVNTFQDLPPDILGAIMAEVLSPSVLSVGKAAALDLIFSNCEIVIEASDAIHKLSTYFTKDQEVSLVIPELIKLSFYSDTNLDFLRDYADRLGQYEGAIINVAKNFPFVPGDAQSNIAQNLTEVAVRLNDPDMFDRLAETVMMFKEHPAIGTGILHVFQNSDVIEGDKDLPRLLDAVTKEKEAFKDMVSTFDNIPLGPGLIFNQMLEVMMDSGSAEMHRVYGLVLKHKDLITQTIAAKAEPERKADAFKHLLSVTAYSQSPNALPYYSKLIAKNDVTKLEAAPDFVEFMHANIHRGSTEGQIYELALVMNSFSGTKHLEDLFMERKITVEMIGNMLKEHAIPIQLMSEEEKLTIFRSLDADTIDKYKRNIAAFLGLRAGESYFIDGKPVPIVVSGFNNLGTIEIGHIPINSSKIQFSSLQEIVDTTVLGINGSRSDPTWKLKRDKLRELFGEGTFSMAQSGWESIKKQDLQDLVAAYARFTSDPTAQKGKAVLDVFRNGLVRISDPRAAEALSDIVDTLEGSFTNNVLEKGSALVAYTIEGKANALAINSALTSCCAFLPSGAQRISTINYGLDPGVVLLNMSVAQIPLKVEFQQLPVNGVAIGALGRLYLPEGGDISHRRLLYVDSVEGGIKFDEATAGREKEVLALIRKWGAKLGAEYVAFSTQPGNSTPRKFVSKVATPREEIPMDLHLTAKQYLEGVNARPGHGLQNVAAKLVRL
jgi:hypothetical protein